MIYGFELETNETNKNQNRLYVLFFFVVFLSFFSFCFLVVLCHCRCSLTNDNGNGIGNGHRSTYKYNRNPLRPTSSGIIEARHWYDTFWFIDYMLQTVNGSTIRTLFQWLSNGLSSFFSLFLHRYCQIIIYQSKWWPHISRWLKNQGSLERTTKVYF